MYLCVLKNVLFKLTICLARSKVTLFTYSMRLFIPVYVCVQMGKSEVRVKKGKGGEEFVEALE